MVKVTYSMLVCNTYNRWDDYPSKVAYFPTYKAAMRIIALWGRSTKGLRYAITDSRWVPNDPRKWHPDCQHYSHLCK